MRVRTTCSPLILYEEPPECTGECLIYDEIVYTKTEDMLNQRRKDKDCRRKTEQQTLRMQGGIVGATEKVKRIEF